MDSGEEEIDSALLSSKSSQIYDSQIMNTQDRAAGPFGTKSRDIAAAAAAGD